MTINHLHTPEARAKAAANRKATPSLRKSINRKCLDCIYDPKSGGGTWRQQVTDCPATDCPLWAVRPLSKPKRGTGHEQD